MAVTQQAESLVCLCKELPGALGIYEEGEYWCGRSQWSILGLLDQDTLALDKGDMMMLEQS